MLLPRFALRSLSTGLILAGAFLHAAQQPPPDPSLARYGIDEKSAARPAAVEPIATSLPLELRRGDHIVLIGNTLFERGDDYPHFEALLQAAFPDLALTVRSQIGRAHV